MHLLRHEEDADQPGGTSRLIPPAPTGLPTLAAVSDPSSLVDHLLAEQDRVIQQLDALELEIQRVIAAHLATPNRPAADAA